MGYKYQPEYQREQLAPVIIPSAIALEYAGRIIREDGSNGKQLEYDGTYKNIPATITIDSYKGLVHIYGRNDMTTSQKMGIWWMIFDPDDKIVETYSNWELGTTSPGKTNPFTGDRFDLNKVGTYVIDVMLFMNQASPVIVDEYYGTLCTIKEAPPPPPPKGKITRKRLEHDGYVDNIPVYDLSLEDSGLVRITGRNDSPTEQDLGIQWIVFDPDENIVESFSVWHRGLNPSDDWEFKGDRFDFDKLGTYHLSVMLLMNPDNPVIVDEFEGILGTVVREEFAGTITKKELEYNETQVSIPASNVPIGQRGLVHVWGRNNMATTQALGISWVVRDSSGAVVESYSDWSYDHGPGDDHEFLGRRFDLDKEGTYTLKVDLLMGDPGNAVVVDSYAGFLCSTTTEIPAEYEEIYHHEYPRAKTYVGKAEDCTAKLTVPLPNQFFPSNWVAERIANAFADEVAKEGGEMLDVKIYEDATPTWHTDYVIKASAIASPIPWALIIVAVLAIILIVAFTNLIIEFKDIDWGKAAFPVVAVALAVTAVAGVGLAIAASRKKGR